MRAKKSLGQNFLSSRRALSQIIQAGKIEPGEIVLEVGPGRGALTRFLLAAGAKVISVEKDDELTIFLKKEFEAEVLTGNLTLLNTDILEINPNDLGLSSGKYKIIANIPYYITGQFLRKFISGENTPKSMVLLLQKEVVSRIIARDGKESILSLSVKAYGTAKLIGKVPAREFRPAPKVDSAIIAIENISKKNFPTKASEEKFFALIKSGFAHKRKKLIRNLETLSDAKRLESAFEKCKIPSGMRAEDLTIDDWLALSQQI